jgi:hypothetical protein
VALDGELVSLPDWLECVSSAASKRRHAIVMREV